jgi:hypothetical protein
MKKFEAIIQPFKLIKTLRIRNDDRGDAAL